MKRAHKSPVFRNKKAGNRMVLGHGTEDVRPLPVPEQVVGAIACGRSGRSQQWNRNHGRSPWRLALLSFVDAERLPQALQELMELLYHLHGVYAVSNNTSERGLVPPAAAVRKV
jgi:hypothetical protein